jgi:hypothetical protein
MMILNYFHQMLSHLFLLNDTIIPSRTFFGMRMKNMNILSKNVMRYGHILSSSLGKRLNKKVRLGMLHQYAYLMVVVDFLLLKIIFLLLR